jgi:hypothetical protein
MLKKNESIIKSFSKLLVSTFLNKLKNLDLKMVLF